MADKPQHSPLTQFAIVNDELQIGGKPLSQLAKEVGSTPFYAYDREAISKRVSALREQLPAGISLHYAMKANPMPELVSHTAKLVDGLDIASGGEMKVALDTGMDAAEISFAGPGKSTDEIQAAITTGVTLNLESFNELERASQIGDKLGIQAKVAIRVNPDFELKSSGMKMSGGPKPFGIDAEEVPNVLKRISELNLHFRGFHIFSGSQNLKADSLIETHNATFELAYQLAESTPSAVELLNIGGGFGIPYFPGDRPLDLQPVCANLEQHVSQCKQRLPNAEIVVELGRYIVGEAGIYVCKVIDKKISRGQTYLVTNGGLHHHLAASGNFGQLIRKNYPIVHGTKVKKGEQEEVSVVGPLCTPLDILGDRMKLGKAEIGDLIVVLQSGAYGYTASPHLFLSHPIVVETLV